MSAPSRSTGRAERGTDVKVMFSEPGDHARGSRFERGLRLGLIVAVVVSTLVGAIFIFSDIDRQLEANRVAHLDNRTWVLAQFEVDMLNFASAVHLAQLHPEDPARLDTLRKKFDILYSRIDIVRRFDPEAVARLSEDVLPRFDRPGGHFDRWIPLVDGPDPQLQAALPRLSDELEAEAHSVRAGVVETLSEVMQQADEHRGALRRSLQGFALASLGLLALMAVLIVVVIVQSNTRRRRGVLLERSVHNLRATIESSLDAVVVLDHTGRVVEANHAAMAMFRWAPEAARGANFEDHIPNDGSGQLLRAHRPGGDRPLLEGGTEGRITMMARRTDGSTFPVEVSVAQAQGASQDPFFIAFIRDISERLEREESLKKARNDALKGEEAKSRFLAVMSHEMRTPLNGLMAASDLLQTSTELTERQRWLTDIILGCGTAALDQVNNVLELTRLSDRSGASAVRSAFSPVEVIEGLIRQNQPQAGKRGNRLWFAPPRGPVPCVMAERHLFLRVMYNLIGNAIKFTDNGKVSVELLCRPAASAGHVDLLIHVNDTGIGIAEEHLDTIFRNFETLDSSYGRIREGTGLGLGIAKLAAETMGGRITVQSKLGLGSVFTLQVTVPVAAAEEITEDEPDDDLPVIRETARSILVAEDNPINRQLMAEVLRMAGHEVTLAEDGAEAVQAAADRRFDLILMDVSMPRVDGLEATRLIRQGGASATVPIVGATAHADPDRIPEFLAAGMDDVLVKPITRAALFRAIRAQTGGGDGGGSDAAPRDSQRADLRAEPPRLPVADGDRRVAARPGEASGDEDFDPDDDGDDANIFDADLQDGDLDDDDPDDDWQDDMTRHPDAPPPVHPLIDEDLRADLAGNLGPDYIAGMMERVVTETGAALPEMRRLHAAGDHCSAAKLAHKTAGAAAAVGLVALHRTLARYETAAGSDDADEAAVALECLPFTLEATAAAIRHAA